MIYQTNYSQCYYQALYMLIADWIDLSLVWVSFSFSYVCLNQWKIIINVRNQTLGWNHFDLLHIHLFTPDGYKKLIEDIALFCLLSTAMRLYMMQLTYIFGYFLQLLEACQSHRIHCCSLNFLASFLAFLWPKWKFYEYLIVLKSKLTWGVHKHCVFMWIKEEHNSFMLCV